MIARVTEILPAGSWVVESACDFLCLTYDDRHRRRLRYTAAGGTTFLLDLPRATVLGAGDGLRLDDGRVVHVAAACEALAQIKAPDAITLTRLAWHIGNRHVPAQIEAERIVIRDDPVIVAMLVGLGAKVTAVAEAFSPESGAYQHDAFAHLGHGHAVTHQGQGHAIAHLGHGDAAE